MPSFLPRACVVPVVLAAMSVAVPALAQETPSAASRGGNGVAPVTVVGVRSVPTEAITTAAVEAAQGKTGDAAIRAAVEAVVAEYRRRGFPVAQVVASERLPDGTLRLTVAEGTVRRIVVRGIGKTRASTIRDAIAIRPGDVFQEEKIAADRDRLARLGIFEEVSITPALLENPAVPEKKDKDAEATENRPIREQIVAAPAAPAAGGDDMVVGMIDVIVRVKERRTGNLAAALGFGSRSGVVGYVDVAETNFSGRAQQVSAQWQRWSRARFLENGTVVEEDARSAYRVSYFAPFLGRGRTAFGFDVYDQNTIFQPIFAGDDETIRSYERRRGGSVRVGRRLGRTLSFFLTGRRDDIGYDPLPLRLNPPFAEIAAARGSVAALGGQLIADTRDAATNPRRGHLWMLSYENAGSVLGGDHEFGQAVLDLRQYLPIRSGENGPVLALRLLGGTSSGTVPLPEQFWIGGYDLLRGYDLYSIRGDRLLLASVEARFPLGQGIQGAVFTDFGNAWKPEQTVSLSDLQAGVGLGLRFLTPIGPIRLDAAYGDGLKTYVSLGQAY